MGKKDKKKLTRREFLKAGARTTTAVAGAALVGGALMNPGRIFAGRGEEAEEPAKKSDTQKKPVQLSVQTMPGPRWGDSLQAMATEYMRQNPDKKVDVIILPFSEHYAKMAAALGVDSPDMDLYVFDAALIGQSHSKLYPMDKLMDDDPAWRDDYLSDIPYEYRGGWDWEGIPYALVHDANGMMAWWRKDVFEDKGLKIPTTFEIMLENAHKLRGGDKYGFMTDATRGAYTAVLFTGMMDAFGGRWWENDVPEQFGRISRENPPGRVMLTDPETVAAMTMLRDLVKIGDPASLSSIEFETVAAFQNGTLLQALTWSGLMMLQNPDMTSQADQLFSGNFPIGGGPNGRQGGIKGGFGLAIPKASTQIEEVFDFAKFVVSSENMGTFIEAGGQPARVSVLEDYAKKDHKYQVFSSIAKVIRDGHPQAQFPEGQQFYEIMGTETALVLTGDKTPEKGLADMQRQTEDLLKRAGYV